MAEKNKRTHGFISHISLFVAYDPAKSETITAASEKLMEATKDLGADIVVVKTTPPAAHSISGPKAA